MEETLNPPKNPSSTSSFNLPPGCRFYPSEQQIFDYYLTHKNNNNQEDTDRVRADSDVAETVNDHFDGFNVIKEVDFYNHDPFHLPEIACFSYGYRGRKQHWYCYMPNANGGRWRRRRSVVVGRGYWKRKGKERNVFGIVGKDNVLLGTRTSFVFCLGNLGKNAVKTDWFMYQYALIDHLKAFVLCRIFIKSRCESLSDHVPSSCAEGSVSIERHITPQRHQTETSDDAGDKACDNHIICSENEIFGFPMRAAQELDDIITDEPVSTTRFGTPPDNHLNELMSDQDWLSILEEDFIELDDLSCPLLGSDEIG